MDFFRFIRNGIGRLIIQFEMKGYAILKVLGLHGSKTIQYFCNYCLALVNFSLVLVSVNMKSIIILS